MKTNSERGGPRGLEVHGGILLRWVEKLGNGNEGRGFRGESSRAGNASINPLERWKCNPGHIEVSAISSRCSSTGNGFCGSESGELSLLGSEGQKGRKGKSGGKWKTKRVEVPNEYEREETRSWSETGDKEEGGRIHERKKGTKNNLRSRVHPQNASRDARGLFERSLGRQPRTWARRETQHAARDEREKDKHKKGKDAILSEQWKTRGTLARNGSHESRERTQNMKETKEKSRENVVQREAAEDGSMAEA
ncbi:hypothetical protein BGW80DRAFT_1448233 [Lactifluus volemus]|nr:hypothetical protein BGW80DRAFT_1448233 [Lactifluus volemus]